MIKSVIHRIFFAFLFIATCLVSCNDGNEAQPTPVVESYSPVEDFGGQTIMILGENFGTTVNDVNVYFYDNMEADILALTNTSISVVVPGNAYKGPITVKVKSKESTGPSDFTVLELCWSGGNLNACPRIKPLEAGKLKR